MKYTMHYIPVEKQGLSCPDYQGPVATLNDAYLRFMATYSQAALVKFIISVYLRPLPWKNILTESQLHVLCSRVSRIKSSGPIRLRAVGKVAGYECLYSMKSTKLPGRTCFENIPCIIVCIQMFLKTLYQASKMRHFTFLPVFNAFFMMITMKLENE